MMYVQCEIRKGSYVDVTWMEEKFAIVGNTVRRKNEHEEWEDGWTVTATYGKTSEEHVKKMRDLHKHHRKATDI